MHATTGQDAASEPTDETVRATFGAALLSELAAQLGTPNPMAANFDPNAACTYALACILQFAHFSEAQGHTLLPLHDLAQLAADVALGRTGRPEGEPTTWDDGAAPAVRALVAYMHETGSEHYFLWDADEEFNDGSDPNLVDRAVTLLEQWLEAQPEEPPVPAAPPGGADVMSGDELVDAVHALVRHVQSRELESGERAGDAVAENNTVAPDLERLTRWLDAPGRAYLADYRARRPARNTYAAACYGEWARLDAEDTESALDVRAVEDAFENYDGPLSWPQFEAAWYRQDDDAQEPETEQAPALPASWTDIPF